MDDQGGLGIDDGLGALEGAEALLVDLAVAADDGVGAFGDGDLLIGLAGIEDDDDVAPVVTACIVLQAVGDEAFGHVEELEVLAHEIGIAKTEGGVMLAQGDEAFVIVEHLRVFRLVAPVEVIDLIGRLK